MRSLSLQKEGLRRIKLLNEPIRVQEGRFRKLSLFGLHHSQGYNLLKSRKIYVGFNLPLHLYRVSPKKWGLVFYFQIKNSKSPQRLISTRVQILGQKRCQSLILPKTHEITASRIFQFQKICADSNFFLYRHTECVLRNNPNM